MKSSKRDLRELSVSSRNVFKLIKLKYTLERIATLKVILLGNANVGKTSIINKYVKDVFYDKTCTTVGVDFSNKFLSKEELRRATRTTSAFGDIQFMKKSASVFSPGLQQSSPLIK